MNIPTPYDHIIAHLAAFTGQAGFDSTQRRLEHWRDMQAAYRHGVEAERKRREEVTVGKAELQMVKVDAPGFKGEHTVHPSNRCRCTSCRAEPEHYWTADPETCPCAKCGQNRAMGAQDD